MQIWGATRVPLGGKRDPAAQRPPVSINLPPRWRYYFCLLHVLPRQWQRWSRSSALLHVPASHTSCGFCFQTPRLPRHHWGSSRPVPFRPSPMQRIHMKPVLPLSTRHFRHISDICPWRIALISTLPEQKQLNFCIIRRLLEIQLPMLGLHPAFTQPLVLVYYSLGEHLLRCGIDTSIYIVSIIMNTLWYNRFSRTTAHPPE